MLKDSIRNNVINNIILDTSNSCNAKLIPLALNNITFSENSFWGKYQRANISRSIPKLFELFEQKGILDNFRRISGQKQCQRKGPWFSDSDIYKWLEAAAYTLSYQPNDNIRTQYEIAVETIISAQQTDGYLNTYFTEPNERFTEPNAHEFYCLGHLIQAAIAAYRGLNDKRLLSCALKFVELIYNEFGPNAKKQWASGHPEIELALVELFRLTKEKKYLEFAWLLLDRLNIDASWKTKWSRDITVKFKDRTELYHHAVRNLYLACAGSDIWAETGDTEIGQAVFRLWKNLINRKIYITGGVGSRYVHEMIGLNFELPNLFSYAETCAAIGNIFWNFRNLQITADGKFADWLERSLYNGMLSGLSLDYTKYFYVNPLASFGEHQRKEWFDTTCCPTNLMRIIASLTSYLCSTDKRGNIRIHIYDSYTVEAKQCKLTLDTNYPFDGRIKIAVTPQSSNDFSIYLRIPDWAESFCASVNNSELSVDKENGYIEIKRFWSDGDIIELTMPMPIKFIAAHPHVINDYHRLAITRGPLIYCLESVDNSDFDSVHLLAVDSHELPELVERANIAKIKICESEITAIKLRGKAFKPIDALYYSVSDYKSCEIPTKLANITAIPYYAWANRGESQMTIWLACV